MQEINFNKIPSRARRLKVEYIPYKKINDQFTMENATCFFIQDEETISTISINIGRARFEENKYIVLLFKGSELIKEELAETKDEAKTLFKRWRLNYKSIKPTEEQLKYYQKYATSVNCPKSKQPKIIKRMSGRTQRVK